MSHIRDGEVCKLGVINSKNDKIKSGTNFAQNRRHSHLSRLPTEIYVQTNFMLLFPVADRENSLITSAEARDGSENPPGAGGGGGS